MQVGFRARGAAMENTMGAPAAGEFRSQLESPLGQVTSSQNTSAGELAALEPERNDLLSRQGLFSVSPTRAAQLKPRVQEAPPPAGASG